MITFKKMTYRNLLSYGNVPTTIDFDSVDTTIIVGTNGEGKCLHWSTPISVKMYDEKLAEYFDTLYDISVETTVGQIADFYNEYPEYIGEIDVYTRYGYKAIEYADITAYNSDVYELTCGGKVVQCSPDHRFMGEEDWVHTKDIAVGDKLLTEFGLETVESLVKMDYTEDLYDLQVADVHEFYANGIVSHNSSFMDALSYALYGKPFRKIKLPELINRYNRKKLEVTLEFEIDGVEYVVHRAMKPNKFDVTVNGRERVHDASVRDQQGWLEGVLGMSEKSFRQIIVLGSGNYTPFMQLSTADRRKIIEQVLDIEIFSLMNVVLKEKVHTINTHFNEVERDHDILEREVETDRKHIRANEVKKSVSTKKIDDEIASLEDDIGTLNKENESIVIENVEPIKIKRGKLLEIKSATRNKINTHSKYIDTITEAGDVCPTCTQSISEDFRQGFIESNETNITELEDNVSKMMEMMDQMNERIETNRERYEVIKANEYEIDNKLTVIKRLRASKDEVVDDGELKVDVEKKSNELKDLRRNMTSIKKMVGHYGAVEMMLKDSGIKAKIIKKYLPVLNNIINKYLRVFEFNVVMKLDETFSETITQNGREMGGYMVFSEGEKLRMDLAVLFAFRELARVKNSVNTNLLLMDEVLDKSMDINGVENFLSIMHQLDKAKVFVISHKPDLQDKFNRVLTVSKKGQFSEMAETIL